MTFYISATQIPVDKKSQKSQRFSIKKDAGKLLHRRNARLGRANGWIFVAGVF